MKYVVSLVLAVIILSGCGVGATEMDRAISLRNALLQSQGCTFEAVITADYGSKIYTFRMNCALDENNILTFVVLEPDTITGISGKFASDGGKLIFDETVLAFPALTDGQLTPVSAPWILMNTLRTGYITACGIDGDGLRIRINDSYETDALTLDIYTDVNDIPVCGEILWKDRRILSVDIRNFSFL